MKKECVLYDRECTGCGECDICDLDPKKICDNCGKCIDSGNDYNTADVELIAENGGMPLNYHFEDEEETKVDEEFEVYCPDEDEFDQSYDEDFPEDSYQEDEYFDDDTEFDFGEFFGKR